MVTARYLYYEPPYSDTVVYDLILANLARIFLHDMIYQKTDIDCIEKSDQLGPIFLQVLN